MKIIYEFLFENDRTERFECELNQTNLNMVPFQTNPNDTWTHLEYHQCPDCTLKASETPVCPVARNLSYILDKFKNDLSYTRVLTRVTVNERIIEKKVSLEEGVSAIMGLVMATSGCPILDRFKPMAFTHLPFANENETILRAIATYLTAQLIRSKQGLSVDWELVQFKNFYLTVNHVNMAFCERVRAIAVKDANLNALVLLDLFAQNGYLSKVEDWINSVTPYFSAYFTEK
jgi:hypothetical protein